MSRMRLFAAVLPPESALAELAGAVRGLHDLPGAERLRWTDPAGWHLLLAFYGAVAEESLPGLSGRLARAAHRVPPHGLRLAGGGRFAQRVLWAGIGGDLGDLGRLAHSAEAAGRHTGIPMPEGRPYRPHLTLARNQAGVGLARFADELADFAGTGWQVTRMRLMRSHPPGTAGERPRYETIEAWPLGD